MQRGARDIARLGGKLVRKLGHRVGPDAGIGHPAAAAALSAFTHREAPQWLDPPPGTELDGLITRYRRSEARGRRSSCSIGWTVRPPAQGETWMIGFLDFEVRE